MAGKLKAVSLSKFNEHFEIERDILAEAGVELTAFQGSAAEEVLPVLKDADALLVGNNKITEEIIQGLTKCKIIIRYGIGVDNIDVGAATRQKIIVSNVPDYCIEEVSGHTVTLLLAWIRKIVQSDKVVREGKWASKMKVLSPMPRLQGRTLGILGFGRIGRAVAEKAFPFGFRILACDPYVKAETIEGNKVALVDFDTLLRESDYITVHVPAMPQTIKLMGEAEFGKMKASALIINTSRGATLDEQALIKALSDKRIAGAALDVLTKEPPDPENPLLKMENVLLTPHSAFYTEESFVELHRKAAEEAARVLKGEKALYAVNGSI